MISALRWLTALIALGLGLGFAGSFAGAWHPAGDSLAVFRLPLAVMLALVVIWTNWPGPLRWLVAVACIGAMVPIVVQKYTTHLPGPVTVYQKNLLFSNRAGSDLQFDIRRVQPDVLAVQEMTSRNVHILDDLRDILPHQASCAVSDLVRVAILSRWPIEDRLCTPGRALLGAKLRSPEGVFWAVSLHASWPWPDDQRMQSDGFLPVLAGLDAPVVISGDFNMVPWGFVTRRMAAQTGTTRAGPLFATLTQLGAPLPIDHVYAPGGGRAEPRPRFGSDHLGVVAQVFVFD